MKKRNGDASRPRALLAIVLLFFLSVKAPSADSPDRPSRVENGLLPPVLVEGEKGFSMLERMKHYDVPGLAVAVWNDFKLDWSKGYGVADRATGATVTADTLFQAGSISKSLTAVTVLRKAQEGKLSLEQDINTLLTSWKVPENDLTRKTPVTPARLLSHTAGTGVPGFPGFEPGEAMPNIKQELDGAGASNTRQVRVEAEPGARIRYSGGGYLVLQQALIDLERKPFDKILAETVLTPLGMSNSTFAQPLARTLEKRAAAGHDEQGHVLAGKRNVYPEMAAAGLSTTAADVARFAIALQMASAGRDERVLSKASARRMLTAAAGTGGRMGLGAFLVKRGGSIYFAHPGGNAGFFGIYFAHLDRGYGAVVLANSENAEPLAFEILRSVAKEYGWDGYLPAPLKVVALDGAALDRFAGRYQLDADTVLGIRREGDHLVAAQTLSSDFALFPTATDQFIRKDEALQYKFKSDGTLTIEGNGETLAGKRIAPDLRIPSEMLEAGDVERAVEAYKKLDEALLSEARLRQIGLELLKRKKTASAIGILRLNADRSPRSSAAHDALAQGYEAAGQTALAVATSEMVLELLKDDFTATASWRVLYRKNAVKRLDRLRRTQ
jgi:CubicO group peptidase (beta-lactamase class C family)